MTCQQIGFNNRIKTLRDIFSFVFPNVPNYQPTLIAKDIVYDTRNKTDCLVLLYSVESFLIFFSSSMMSFLETYV